MRQSNQKSRPRGRGRKPQNPMSRNFESNGPDVKIRGNASHVAEKYTTLARDALSNGDRVIAENYLQHAEHYNRIVAAAQQQSEARAAEMAAKNPQPDVENEGSDDSEVNASDGNQENTSKADSANNSSDENSSPESAPKERKNTRTRRPRKQPVAEASDRDDKQEAKSDEEKPVVEAISDDAAKLPGSLLGGMVAEEG